MPPTTFQVHLDNLIAVWMKNRSSLTALLPKGASLSIDYLPEPYYGDMDNSSIVIINMNPGVGLCCQCWHRQNDSGTEVNEAKVKKYSGYAKPFHYLDRAYTFEGTYAAAWWKPRNAWMNRILSNLHIQTDARPFAIELSPFHSPRFGIKDLAGHVIDLKRHGIDIVSCIEHAVLHSRAKLGLAVGKKIYDALTDKRIGYTPISHWPPFVGSPGSLPQRKYALIEKNGVKILCTWAPGSNNAPSSTFSGEEAAILSSIMNSKVTP